MQLTFCLDICIYMHYLYLSMYISIFLSFFFLIEIHFMQGWTATRRYGVTKKDAQKD